MVTDFSNRYNYIGGSDCNVILQDSKFKTALKLLYEKTGYEEIEITNSLYAECGNILEPKIREVLGYENVDGVKYEKTINGIQFVCQLDGMSKKGDEILEIKVTSAKDLEECYNTYQYQIDCYMMVVDVQKAVLAFLKRDGEIKDIVNSVIFDYIEPLSSGRPNYLHNLKECSNEAEIVQELENRLSKVEITKDMIAIKKIKRSKTKEHQNLCKLKAFWDLKMKLENDPFMYQDEFLEYRTNMIKHEKHNKKGELC